MPDILHCVNLSGKELQQGIGIPPPIIMTYSVSLAAALVTCFIVTIEEAFSCKCAHNFRRPRSEDELVNEPAQENSLARLAQGRASSCPHGPRPRAVELVIRHVAVEAHFLLDTSRICIVTGGLLVVVGG